MKILRFIPYADKFDVGQIIYPKRMSFRCYSISPVGHLTCQKTLTYE